MKKKHDVMEGKRKYIWILFAVVLCLLISPCAATTLDSYDVIYSDWTNLGSNMMMEIQNISKLPDITKIELTNAGFYDYGVSADSTSVDICESTWDAIDGSYLGTGTLSYTCAPDNDYFSDCTVTLDAITWDTGNISLYTGHAFILFHGNYNQIISYTGNYYNVTGHEYGLAFSVGNCNGMSCTGRGSWGHYEITGVPSGGGAPVCGFSATPTSGQSPLDITFADTSSNTPTSWDWLIQNNGTPIIESLHSTLQSSTGTLHQESFYDVNFSASNAYGSCNIFSPKYFTITTASTVIVDVAAYDAITHNAISGATVGIQNTTSNLWTNATASTGSYIFSSSDGTLALPLSIGQTLYTGASAIGYSDNGHLITIPYSGYSTSIALMPTSAINATGTFWLTVTVTKNEDGLPLNSAVVQVLSGGNSYQHYTGSNGMTTFQNITSSTTFSVTAFAQAYAAQTKVLPKDADFMNTSFSLVRIGATPVTTPASPTPTGTPAPIYTNAAGQVISAPEGQATDVFARIAAALGGWASLAIGIVQLTLLWMLVYALTGGDIINKIMKRGRGGRK